MYFLGVKAAGA